MTPATYSPRSAPELAPDFLFSKYIPHGATIAHSTQYNISNTKWSDQSLKLYKLSLVPVRGKALWKICQAAKLQSGNGEEENSAKHLVWEGSHLERVSTKHGPGVRRPPLWTGSTDHYHGPGSCTPVMDRVHGHFVNFYRKVLHRIHKHSFLNSESWTKTEKKNKIWRDAVDRCSRLITST